MTVPLCLLDGAFVTGSEVPTSDGNNTLSMEPHQILVPIAMFAMIFGIVYITVTSRHRQRMAMIDKGMDPGLLKEREVPFRTLRNGLVLVGAGIGLFLGYLLDSRMPGYGVNGDMGDTPLPYFMMVMLCCGIALIVHHFIVRRQKDAPAN